MQPLRHAGTSLHKEVRALDKQYKAYHKEYKYKGKWGIVNDFSMVSSFSRSKLPSAEILLS